MISFHWSILHHLITSHEIFDKGLETANVTSLSSVSLRRFQFCNIPQIFENSLEITVERFLKHAKIDCGGNLGDYE